MVPENEAKFRREEEEERMARAKKIQSQSRASIFEREERPGVLHYYL